MIFFPIYGYYWGFSLLLVIYLIIGVIWWILCSLPPVIGGALGAIVAFFLASRHLSDQEKEKIEVQKTEKRLQIAKGLIIELDYITKKIRDINSEQSNFLIQNSENIEKCVNFVNQIQTFYSTKRLIVINSIRSDLGIFIEPSPEESISKETIPEKILTVYYELNLLNEKFVEISSNPHYHKFAPELIKQIPELNSKLDTYISALKDDLNKLIGG